MFDEHGELVETIVVHRLQQGQRLGTWGMTLRMSGSQQWTALAEQIAEQMGWGGDSTAFLQSLPDWVHALPLRDDEGGEWTAFDFVSDRAFFVGKYPAWQVRKGETLPHYDLPRPVSFPTGELECVPRLPWDKDKPARYRNPWTGK